MEKGGLFGWIRLDRRLVAGPAERNGETAMINHDSFRKAALVLAMLIVLPGCMVMARRQTDQPVSAENVERLDSGMTRQQVTDLLGAPQEIIFSNKEHDPLREHAYIYEYEQDAGTAIFFGIVNFGNLDTKRDRVVVFFNEEGLVSNVGSSLHGDEARYGFPFGK